MFAERRLAQLYLPRLTLRTLVDRIVAADRTYRSREHLSRLDERMLRDMGVTRADVDHILGRPRS